MSRANFITNPAKALINNPKVREAALDIGITAARQAASLLLARQDSGLPSAKVSEGMPKSRSMAPQRGNLLALGNPLPSMVQRKSDNPAAGQPLSQAGTSIPSLIRPINPDDVLPRMPLLNSWLAANNPAQARYAPQSREHSAGNPVTPQQAAFHAAPWGGRTSPAPPLPPKILFDSAEQQPMTGVPAGRTSVAPPLPLKIPLDSTEEQPRAGVPGELAPPTPLARQSEGPPPGARPDRSTTGTPASPLPATAEPNPFPQAPPTASWQVSKTWTGLMESVRNYFSEVREGAFSGRQRGGNEGFGNADSSGSRTPGPWN